ncbi:hypothetical protein EYR41_002890 [Orbilia oligospora]|uniref:Uncharacterized protein n=1 Tax=Orbilia oligospora TaxID=2813651 RepID=A0A7C8PR60_ORBOL|nr:hypothetical protein TWF751_004782 [Orbilia oligospora]TGJ70873.1 hypothetical protein EYR41_002890 [Orbilia oligospora]
MRMPGTLAAKCSATVKFSGTGKAQLWLVKENTPRPGRTRKKPAERGQTADLGWMHCTEYRWGRMTGLPDFSLAKGISRMALLIALH